MGIIQNKVNNTRFLWTLVSIIVLIGYYLSLVGFAEYFNVAVVGEPRWHQSCWYETIEVPWYYQSSYIYPSYIFISGLIFLNIAILTLCASIQKKSSLSIIGVTFIILFIVAEYMSSYIMT